MSYSSSSASSYSSGSVSYSESDEEYDDDADEVSGTEDDSKRMIKISEREDEGDNSN